MATSVSVVIPTYRGERLIARALSSVLCQTVLPGEIIVVDDCSPDATVDVVNRFSADSRVPIRVMRLSGNSGGPAEPMNCGIDAAGSPLVALLDQDDCMAPRKIELHAQALTEFPAALACGIMEKVMPDGSRVRNDRVNACYSRPEFARLSNGAVVVPSDAVFRNLCQCFNYGLGGASGMTLSKPHWERLQRFDPDFRLLWDVEFETRIAAAGLPVIHVPELSHERYLHGENLSLSEQGLNYYPFAFRLLRKHRQQKSFSVQQQQELQAAIVDTLLGTAYHYREAGKYRSAMRLYTTIVRETGLSLRAVLGLVKIPAVAALHALQIRRSSRQ
jgi:glycosyltransferase involved in cell wall biosynthesis